MRYFLALFIIVLSSSVLAEEPVIIESVVVIESTVDLSKLQDAAREYVQAKCTQAEREAWTSVFSGKVKDRAGDNSEESAAKDIVIDWLSDHQRELDALKDGAVKTACLCVIYFADHEYTLPKAVLEQLTEQNRHDLFSFLKEEVAEAKEKSK